VSLPNGFNGKYVFYADKYNIYLKVFVSFISFKKKLNLPYKGKTNFNRFLSNAKK